MQTTDFLQDEDVLLRDHCEATVLIDNPNNREEKPKINLVRQNDSIPDDKDDFLKTSKLWRCLSCLKLGDYSDRINIFNACVMKERLPNYLMPGNNLLGKY